MTIKSTMVAAMTVTAMTVTPMALASGAAAHPGTPHTPPAKAEAYGKYCQGQSKKHVKGQKGTPFSQCVAAMRKLDAGTETNPAKACATESKKHVAGQKGTPYSDCVSAGAKLLAAQQKAAAAS
jgi:hypothetical protein